MKTFLKQSNDGWVDLGLPSGVKWATCNLGAKTPEEYGDYFAWGEITSKKDYSWETYTFTKGLRRYNNIDNQTILEADDDAARVNIGSNWRMPTIDEWKELKNNCTWRWTTLNGKAGYHIMSKNGKSSIFLPAAGLINESDFYDVYLKGYYWSSMRHPTEIETALCIHFYSDGTKFLSYTHRNIGFTIRPVLA